MKLKFNPFSEFGITDYSQYKNYEFLVFDSLKIINSRVDSATNQMKNGYFFQERLALLGDRGIGKTSTLFYIKDKFEKVGFRCELLSKLPQDEDHLMSMIKMNKALEIKQKGLSNIRLEFLNKETFNDITSKPIYLLFDFPDGITPKDFRGFLVYIWNLMTHPNMKKINLIFAMNKSHYDKSFSYGETLGKFTTLRIERLDFDSSVDLIQSRLDLVNKKVRNIFKGDCLVRIYSYSKGVPRNIISACKLLIDYSNGKETIDEDFAEELFKERYVDQVINDRVEDLELRRIYKQMIKILKDDFKGISNSQEEFLKKCCEVTDIGRNSAISRLNELVRFGVLARSKGGYNRLNKIISFN